jgi:diguanylate cyclase (GGDEF)-like protein
VERTRILAKLVAIAVMGFLWLDAARAGAAERAPMQIHIDAPRKTGERFSFVVHVLTPGTPVLLVPGGHPRSATLEIDGKPRQIGGATAMVGAQPFGNSVIALELRGLAQRDVILVRVDGGDETLEIAENVALLTTAARNGLLSGMYFALLFCIAAIAGIEWLRRREWTALWFVIWILGSMLAKAGIEGFFGSTGNAVAIATACTMGAGVGMAGFVVTYLRLWPEAPKLFWTACAGMLVAFAMPLLASHVLGITAGAAGLLAPLVGVVPLIYAAAVRWRSGFEPAGILIVGLSAQYATFLLQFVAIQTGDASWFLGSNWISASTAFDLALFGFAAVSRQRFVARQNKNLEIALRRSQFDAHHDPLTGLLNRRGLTAWMSNSDTVSTLFFIDLDGFKAVNDRGGHAAGDAALRSVSGILQGALRDGDAVARVGGDEFVVAFAGEATEAAIGRVRKKVAAEVAALQPLGPADPTRIGASIGIGVVRDNHNSLDEALRAADADAYRVKVARSGSDRRSSRLN